jgi:hypothetical protein
MSYPEFSEVDEQVAFDLAQRPAAAAPGMTECPTHTYSDRSGIGAEHTLSLNFSAALF